MKSFCLLGVAVGKFDHVGERRADDLFAGRFGMGEPCDLE